MSLDRTPENINASRFPRIHRLLNPEQSKAEFSHV
jgi:hypothetical protein